MPAQEHEREKGETKRRDGKNLVTKPCNLGSGRIWGKVEGRRRIYIWEEKNFIKRKNTFQEAVRGRKKVRRTSLTRGVDKKRSRRRDEQQDQSGQRKGRRGGNRKIGQNNAIVALSETEKEKDSLRGSRMLKSRHQTQKQNKD